MPSSFSRFLSEAELLKVRELYLQSLEKEGMAGPETPPVAAAAVEDAEGDADAGEASSS